MLEIQYVIDVGERKVASAQEVAGKKQSGKVRHVAADLTPRASAGGAAIQSEAHDRL